MNGLMACCTVKNEQSIIREWIAFHKVAGFDHLVIVDNGSTDDTVAEIRKFYDQSFVTIVDWPQRTAQTEIYNEIARRYKGQFKWCAFIDADEFVYAPGFADLKDALSHYENYAGLGVYWRIYGSSGYQTNPDGLVIDNFVKRAEDNFVYNRHVKSIVQLDKYVRAVTSHMFELDGPLVDENFAELPLGGPCGFFEHNLSIANKVRMNHYHVRSVEEYDKKSQRGYFGVDDDKIKDLERRKLLFDQHDRNEIPDTSATVYSERVKDLLAR